MYCRAVKIGRPNVASIYNMKCSFFKSLIHQMQLFASQLDSDDTHLLAIIGMVFQQRRLRSSSFATMQAEVPNPPSASMQPCLRDTRDLPIIFKYQQTQ